jgi:hypothetical protein
MVVCGFRAHFTWECVNFFLDFFLLREEGGEEGEADALFLLRFTSGDLLGVSGDGA